MKPRVQKALVVCLDGVRHDVLQSSRTPAWALDGTALAGLGTRLAPASRKTNNEMAETVAGLRDGDYGSGVPAEAGTVPAPLRWKVSG